MKPDSIRPVYIGVGLLLIIICVGVTGYSILEGMDFTEAVFMTIITIATVGFQEVKPLSNPGMWFTSFLIIISFGIFVFVLTSFSRYLIDGVLTNYYRDRKVRKVIEGLTNHVILCGYGRNGSQAAYDLSVNNVPFIVIENDTDIIASLSELGNVLYIEGDATQDDVLFNAKIDTAKALITTLPTDSDNLYVVLTAKEINPTLTIISRASHETSDIKLKRAGATNVIMPDRVGGQRMAKLVTQPDVVEFIDYIMLQEPDNVFIEELGFDSMAKCFEGRAIKELEIRNRTGANIIGLRREDGTYEINPSPDVQLSSRDKIFVLGTSRQINALKVLLVQDIV